MTITGKQFISEPYLKGFWFVAGQLGATEFQIAEITGTSAREIYHTNRKVGSLLAFPYHDRRGNTLPRLEDVEALWTRWKLEQAEIETLPDATFNHFRQIIDPYLEHAR